MKVHEYQAKEILARRGVPLPRGRVASTPHEASGIATEIGRKAVVKAQVHAGGRGRAGGIRIVSSPEEAEEAARQLLGSRLVTAQTGPQGAPVSRVLVEEVVDTDAELYVGLTIDASAHGALLIASEAGGMAIEKVAANAPEKILRERVDSLLGLQPYQARRVALGLNLPREFVRPVASLLENLYGLFEAYDCSLAEINPLTITGDGLVLAVDAKVEFDDDALFRHPEVQDMRDTSQEDPLEVEARNCNISYVKLDGNVGCIVNGAGLALATMDVIGSAGAAPANFLDIGGGADEERVAEALRIILSDENVDRVLVNIFGGILRCDLASRGLLITAEAMPQAVRPMVVRMLGTNAEEGRRILSESRLDVTLVNDLNEAAEAIRTTGTRRP